MLKRLPVHPFIFTAHAVLFLLFANLAEISPREAVWPAIGSLTALAVLLFLFNLYWKNVHKSAVLALYTAVIFFSHMHFAGILPKIFNIFLIAFWIEGAILLVYWLRHLDFPPEKMTTFLNAATLFLLGISVFGQALPDAKGVLSHAPEVPIAHIETQPDIYYIVLDAYAGNGILKENFGYDNSEFTVELEKKGFRVLQDARPNYAFTALSLASSLNMRYLSGAEDMDGHSPDTRGLRRLAEDNEVARFLKKAGYRFINVSGPFSISEMNPHADLNIRTGKKQDFWIGFVHATLLEPFERVLLRGAKDDTRKGFLRLYEALLNIRETPGPKFVFAHIVQPHPPFLFKSDGEPQENIDMTLKGDVWAQRDAYVDQLRFVNQKISAVVDALLAGEGAKPIIILQADHGPSMIDENQPDYRPTLYRQKFEILNAIYLPGEKKELIPDALTPVNTFRFLFNHTFDTTYPFLEDRLYYSTYGAPFAVTDVTKLIAEKSN